MSDLAKEYKRDVFDCDYNNSDDTFCHLIDGLSPFPDQIPDAEIESRYMQDPHVSFVVKAVSALTAAFRLVQLDNCGAPVGPGGPECLRQVHPRLHEDILSNMRKLSFKSMGQGPGLEQGATRHHFSRNGRLVANKQLVYKIHQDMGIASVSTCTVWFLFTFSWFLKVLSRIY